MRLLSLCAGGLAASLLVSSIGCAPALRCGAGTSEVDGVCVPSGNPDAGGPATVSYESLRITGDGAPSVGGESFVAVGLPVTFLASGVFADGTSELPPLALASALTWKVQPDDGSTQLRPHDGVVEVTVNRPGTVTLSVEAASADGFPMRAQVSLTALPGGAVSLRTVSVQDGPWYRPRAFFQSAAVTNVFNGFDGSRGPPDPAVVPVPDGAARLLTQYLVDLPIPDGAGGTVTGTVGYLLDPSRATYAVADGTATVSADGVVRATASGTVHVRAQFGTAAPKLVPIRFVAPSPVKALFLGWEGPIVRPTDASPIEWKAPAGTLTLDKLLATDPGKLPLLTFTGTRAGTTAEAWLVARHGDDPAYFEWLPWSTVPRTVLALPDAYSATDDGFVTMKEPGVGLHVFTSGGLSLPLLVRVHYPEGTAPGLRANPPQVSFPRPSPGSPADCRDLTLTLSRTGAADRALTPVEGLAVGLWPSLDGIPMLDATTSRPLHWCVSRFAAPESMQVTVSFLNAHTDVGLEVRN